jgi:predicted nuclease of predicted toxin-antitoxin system
MKLLVDAALSPLVSDQLAALGHDAIHVRQRGMSSAPDPQVLSLAEEEGRIIVSADTDFGSLLAVRNAKHPSFILLRKANGLRPQQLARIVSRVIEDYAEELASGAVVTVTDRTVRIRQLPIE